MKHPFTTEGVAAWQLSLQPLNNQQLQELAAQITADFKIWLTQTFELAPSQVSYLYNLNESFLQLAAAQVGFAVANSLPVKLTKPDGAHARGTKLIRDKSKAEGDADGDGNVDASGEVEFEITY
ncbi:hypothetical protein [Pedobacter sp. SL55]|uniref:hypothetical protein n=1 Tax=Pedobacter sp. SL55 TaxID=2995161 RepID=UPI0022708458|nr:hypothetical protein [Pedobacter sp. SL55]WAC42251.1 hypothetical protein OVA16_07815 [Pedobacter sp. SL55]